MALMTVPLFWCVWLNFEPVTILTRFAVPRGIIFLLWGASAQQKEQIIVDGAALETTHQSMVD
jgi:uracil DNA glycosylase